MTIGGPPIREPARRRPGRIETLISWLGWVAVTAVAAVLAAVGTAVALRAL